MMTMILFSKIRRMYFRDKLSINEIARRTSLSRNTVKKWLRMPNGTDPVYKRQPGSTKLSPFEDQLKRALIADGYRPKRERRTALKLLEELQKAGYEGGYTQLTDYIRAWRHDASSAAGKHAFVPLKFRWGEAFQFDWSEESLVVGGVYRRLQVAHTKLCASRAFLLAAYPSQSHEMLFDAHRRAFQAFGGVPLRGIYDNMKTAVDKVQKGKNRVVNTRFAAMTAYYLFDPDFCNVASGWEKGIVEKNVQDSRRRIWLDASQQCFASFADLNAWLDTRCRQLWTELPWPERQGMTLQEALELERPELMPMPGVFDGYIEFVARVSSTCLVTVKRNRYSVPCRFANRRISVRLYPEQLELYADDAWIATHGRLLDRDQVSYDWQHYLPLLERKPGALRNGAPFVEMPKPLSSLRLVLNKRPGGDRAMADLLACVPRQGLDAVLAAVESLLAAGVVSIEQVKHLVSTLAGDGQPPAEPQTVITPDVLQIKDAPIADTARYEQLREVFDLALVDQENGDA
ncbi:integrase [Methylomonas methanica]|uniref:Integrase n=2 Tax=Methylomonas methanica TaxID=421 RepID=A0A177LY91_METMH|nr:integrase [Methylomonas methanica]